MPRLIHHLTNPGDLTAATVVCGARDAAVASWDVGRVTCPACRPRPSLEPARGQKPPRGPFRTEKQFQEALRQLAVAHSWLYFHVWDSRKSPPGFPDIACVKGPLLVLAELKLPGKQPTPPQQMWLDALAQVERVLVRVWRPEDWPAIEETFR
jgi:hypothetical protein